MIEIWDVPQHLAVSAHDQLDRGVAQQDDGRMRVAGKGISILPPKNGHPCRAISQRRPRDKDARSSEAAALDPLDTPRQRVSKSQPVTMANLEEMSRVLYSHDWARVQDWVTALDQLATLTDDEIAALVHQAARPPASSSVAADRQWTLAARAGVPGPVATPAY
jgi:hypothetical protein